MYSGTIIKFALLQLAILLSFHALGQVPINLDDPEKIYNLSGFVQVMEDPTNQLTIDDVVLPKYSLRFRADEDGQSHGFSDDTYWFKFKLRNELYSTTDWMLEINYPVLDEVEFYFLDSDGVWQMVKLGDKNPFYEREIQFRNFVIPLKFTDNSVQYYFIKVKTESAIRLPMAVMSERMSYHDKIESELLYGLFYGIMLVMILYNLFIFFTLNDINYFYYVFSIVFATLFFAALSGHAFQYLWYDNPWWANHILPLCMGAWAMCSAAFAKNFLQVRKYSPIIDKLLILVIILGMMIIIINTFIGYALAVSLGAAILGLSCVVIIIAGIFSWSQGNRAARYFTIAWVAFLIGNIFIILVSYGLLPSNVFFVHSAKVGAVIEVILLSLALSDQYSILLAEKEKLQAEALRTQREVTVMLERKVAERTRALQQNKEEVERKSKRLERQNYEITKQNEKIESSIRYAQRIQQVMLPAIDKIQELLPDSFIFYRPRDIVSGDFYWIAEKDDKTLIACIDCTGHGVPGAFMSILGNNLLNEIVNIRDLKSPDQILSELHLGVRKNLHQDATQNQDGMDAAICLIDWENREMDFAGANMPIIYFQNDELNLIKGDKLAIGGRVKSDHVRKFTKHTISFFDPIEVYMFSDGFRDQFGGSNGQKFMMRRFKHLLKDIHQDSLYSQAQVLSRIFDDWVGRSRQIDDVLVIGYRLE